VNLKYIPGLPHETFEHVCCRRYVAAYVDFPKPLIAAVNGPAIGVAVTVLGLFDVVYAADNASFSTPFSRLGQSPEGCASYTFPKIMGHAKVRYVLWSALIRMNGNSFSRFCFLNCCKCGANFYSLLLKETSSLRGVWTVCRFWNLIATVPVGNLALPLE